MKVIPKGDRVLVERIKDPEKYGSLYIPDRARDTPQMGRVLEVGEGPLLPGPGFMEVLELGDGDGRPELRVKERHVFHRQDMIVGPGDIVLYGRFSGVEVSIEQEPFFLLRQDEIIGIVIPDDGECQGALAEE